MAKCECRVCKLSNKIKKALESDDIKLVKEALKEFGDLWAGAESDRDYYKCIVDGNWPSAKEILSKGLKKAHELENKVAKIKLLEAANKGNWEYHNGENRCKFCGEYEFTGEHQDNCPVGNLLELIERTY